MDNWFTIDKVDADTYIISEYRHWEETHCYLLNGNNRSLLIDTGLGISNIYDEVISLLRLLLLTFTGIISADISTFQTFTPTLRNWIGSMANFPYQSKQLKKWLLIALIYLMILM